MMILMFLICPLLIHYMMLGGKVIKCIACKRRTLNVLWMGGTGKEKAGVGELFHKFFLGETYSGNGNL